MEKHKEELNKIKEDWRRSELIEQHQPSGIRGCLDGIFLFTDVKFGDISKGQGDVVVVNCKLESHLQKDSNPLTLLEYLNCTCFIDRIEEVGIYSNIYFSKEFFSESVKNIIN